MSLPPPSSSQAFCDISALEAGIIKVPLAWILADKADDEFIFAPSLSFLVRHQSDTIVFDLGLRKEWRNLPSPYITYLVDHLHFQPHAEQDVVDSLAKGGTKPSDIKRVFVSHMHFDHYGDAAQFPTSQFFVGEGCRAIVAESYPKKPISGIPEDVIPQDRTTYLNPVDWPPIGPFPHAFDFYGDGSLYVVDAGNGHIPGHINFLARTSADGGWIYLAADSVHHWDLLTGKGNIGHHAYYGCAHVDPEEAEKHIERIKTLIKENSRVRVILAHDEPWFSANKDGPAFWPGKIESL